MNSRLRTPKDSWPAIVIDTVADKQCPNLSLRIAQRCVNQMDVDITLICGVNPGDSRDSPAVIVISDRGHSENREQRRRAIGRLIGVVVGVVDGLGVRMPDERRFTHISAIIIGDSR